MALEPQQRGAPLKSDQVMRRESTVLSTLLYGEISAYIIFHGEISDFMLQSCITELALGPFGPQISLSSPVWLLESSWKPSWNHLEPSWSHLEPSWNPLGTLLGLSWSSWSPLGAILHPLGALLEPSWSHLESSWSRPKASWNPLEPSWRPLGCSWRRLGGSSIQLYLFFNDFHCFFDVFQWF